jgi:hypothetical protein
MQEESVVVLVAREARQVEDHDEVHAAPYSDGST